MEFNYYYDFEDCFQLDLSGNPITYVVGSFGAIDPLASYNLYALSGTSSTICANYVATSVSTAATYYVDITMKYDSCNLCMSSITSVITVSGIVNSKLENVSFIGDTKFKVGDVTNIDVVYNDSGNLKFYKSPVIINSKSPYSPTGSLVKSTLKYITYESFNQVIESKGLYYTLSDCSGGTEIVCVSHKFFPNLNEIINVPLQDTPCKSVKSLITEGDFSQVSASTLVIYSSNFYDSCNLCYDDSFFDGISDEFLNNPLTASTILDAQQNKDGSIILGGRNLTHISDSKLYNIGNVLKLDKYGNLLSDFNINTNGSLHINENNFIYCDNDYNSKENFNFDSDFTIEFWINYDTKITDGGIISCFDSINNEGWEIRFDSNNLCVNYNGNQVISSFEIVSEVWNHIAIVRENGNMTLFLNGSGETTTGVTEIISASTETNFFVGRNYDRTTYFDGKITDVRITRKSVYSGNFIPQTTPLKNNQEEFGNINLITAENIVLLLNFKNSTNLLIDSSVYNKVMYESNPIVIESKTDSIKKFKCKCVTFRNRSNSSQTVSYRKCTSTPLHTSFIYSFVLTPFEISPKMCVREDSFGSTMSNPNIEIITSDNELLCIKVDNGSKFICPDEKCGCFTIINDTPESKTLKYTSCVKKYTLNTLPIQPNQEIKICAKNIESTDLKVLRNENLCQPLSPFYPFNYQCVESIPKQCLPLISYPDNGLRTMVSQYDFTINSVVGTLLTIPTTSVQSYVGPWSSQYSMCHNFDIENQNGVLWVGADRIYEFNILNSNFDLEFVIDYFPTFGVRGMSYVSGSTIIASNFPYGGIGILYKLDFSLYPQSGWIDPLTNLPNIGEEFFEGNVNYGNFIVKNMMFTNSETLLLLVYQYQAPSGTNPWFLQYSYPSLEKQLLTQSDRLFSGLVMNGGKIFGILPSIGSQYFSIFEINNYYPYSSIELPNISVGNAVMLPFQSSTTFPNLSGPSSINPNITGNTYACGTSRLIPVGGLQCNPLYLFWTISLGERYLKVYMFDYLSNSFEQLPLGNAPQIIGNDRYSSITHKFDIETQTGKMWITSPSGDVSTNHSQIIYEWDIINSNFDLVYNDFYEITGCSSVLHYGAGLTFISGNTLLISKETGEINSYSGTGYLETLNLNNYPSSWINNFLTLPQTGDSAFITAYTQYGNYVVLGNIQYLTDNKLLMTVTTKYNGITSENYYVKITLQYDLTNESYDIPNNETNFPLLLIGLEYYHKGFLTTYDNKIFAVHGGTYSSNIIQNDDDDPLKVFRLICDPTTYIPSWFGENDSVYKPTGGMAGPLSVSSLNPSEYNNTTCGLIKFN